MLVGLARLIFRYSCSDQYNCQYRAAPSSTLVSTAPRWARTKTPRLARTKRRQYASSRPPAPSSTAVSTATRVASMAHQTHVTHCTAPVVVSCVLLSRARY
eukprot:516224-Rhodomonas_salina.1